MDPTKVNLTENGFYPGAAPQFALFHSRRSVVYSTKGVIACPQPLAAQAGVSIIKQGGNAADAAVATAAALGLTEPCSTGIGGDMFCLFWDEKQKRLSAINGSGRAPTGLSLARCREMGFTGKLLPRDNVNTATVPGAVAGWVDLIERHGSGKLSMQEILGPAIELADGGFPVSEITAEQWVESESMLQHASPNGNEMLKNGKAPTRGQIFKNPALANTLRSIASHGKAGFYKGRVAQEIVNIVSGLGGVMTLEDLENHHSTFEEPLRSRYHDIELVECSPNGQGIIALQALEMIKSLEKQAKIPPIGKLQHNSVEYLHVLIEVLRYAFADGNQYISDPLMERTPIQEILTQEYSGRRVSDFRTDAADMKLRHGNPITSSDTVYFSTSDQEGNACSFIASNASNFGCGVVPKGCGFPLQNRGSGFVLKDGHLNCIKPGKRPYHTIMPAMIMKDGKFETCYGVMGGFMQPQGHLQVLLNLYAFGHNPQEALDAPRICIRPARATLEYTQVVDDAHLAEKSVVAVEEGIDESVVDGLRKLGHEVDAVKGWKRGIFGRGQIIQVYCDPNGERVYCAGSDPRGDGHAVPC